MYHLDWKVEAKNLILILLLAGLLGFIFQQLFFFLFISLLGYCLWMLYQLNSIQSWLVNRDTADLPESRGLWGEVLNGIYRLHKEKIDQFELLESRLNYIRNSFSALADGVVMLDPVGNIEWSNTAAEKLLGLHFPADKGQHLLNLVRNPAFINYYEKEQYNDPLEFSPQQHSDSYLQVQINFFGEGSRLLFIRDITHTHRLQQMRKDFVANVSHELRTPLTVITGYLETISDSDMVSDLRLRRAVDQMLMQSHRMEGLVRDLILLSRLEAVPETVEQNRVELQPMLMMIRDEVQSAVKGERNIEVECDQTLSLIGHEDELRSAFANLVMNAAKYSEDGDTITIRWYADRQSAYLEVQDSGIGIDDHHIPRLTERFYRVDPSRQTETGGPGLGLAIVKHVLSRHQAELNIESQIGVGSTFTCVFPLMRTIVHSDTA